MTTIIELAGIKVAISFLYKETYQRFLPFVSTGCPDYRISLTQERFEEESQTLCNAYPNISLTRSDIEFNALYRDIPVILQQKEIILLHGVLIEMEGLGYLFMGPSGVGKTTHGKNWLKMFPGKSRIINGDKTLVRIENKFIYGYGSPWMGKEKIGVNSRVQLHAICHLSRGKNNQIRPVDSNGSFIEWMYAETMLKDREQRAIELIRWYKRVSSLIPLFELECNTLPESAIVSYHGMCK